MIGPWNLQRVLSSVNGGLLLLTLSRSFMDVVLEEDVALMRTEWSNLAVARIPRTFEIRIKKKWYDKTSGKSTPTWMLVSASQEQNEDGSLKSVMGCESFMDIRSSAPPC